MDSSLSTVPIEMFFKSFPRKTDLGNDQLLDDLAEFLYDFVLFARC